MLIGSIVINTARTATNATMSELDHGIQPHTQVSDGSPILHQAILMLRNMRNILENCEWTLRAPATLHLLTVMALESHDQQHPHALPARLARSEKKRQPNT